MLDRLSDPLTSTPLCSRSSFPWNFTAPNGSAPGRMAIANAGREAFDNHPGGASGLSAAREIERAGRAQDSSRHAQQSPRYRAMRPWVRRSRAANICSSRNRIAGRRRTFLTLCLQAFREHADWAGMSCSSVRVCHNRPICGRGRYVRSRHRYGMNVHPWRKVLRSVFRDAPRGL